MKRVFLEVLAREDSHSGVHPGCALSSISACSELSPQHRRSRLSGVGVTLDRAADNAGCGATITLGPSWRGAQPGSSRGHDRRSETDRWTSFGSAPSPEAWKKQHCCPSRSPGTDVTRGETDCSERAGCARSCQHSQERGCVGDGRSRVRPPLPRQRQSYRCGILSSVELYGEG